MAKSRRWRAVNKAYNREGLKEARKEAMRLMEAVNTGEASVENFKLYSLDGKESLALKQAVMNP